jgi:hypothetical protein
MSIRDLADIVAQRTEQQIRVETLSKHLYTDHGLTPQPKIRGNDTHSLPFFETTHRQLHASDSSESVD